MSVTFSSPKQQPLWKRLLPVFAYGTLAAALLFGWYHRNDSAFAGALRSLETGEVLVPLKSSSTLFEIQSDNAKNGYLVLGTEQGYGGPLTIATRLDTSLNVEKVSIADHMETPVFLRKVIAHGFLEQFKRKDIGSPFQLETDLDAVSGATISSRAIAECVHEGCTSFERDILGLHVAHAHKRYTPGWEETLFLIPFIVGFAAYFSKKKWLRTISLVVSLAILGFYLNRPISLANVASLLLGYLPPLATNPLFYLLIVLVFGSLLLLGKNVYCYWICPFGAAQELASRLAGLSVKTDSKTIKRFQFLAPLFTWAALIIALFTHNAGKASLEPFGTLFALEGSGVQWLILPLVLFSGLLFPRFWCRLFCPMQVVFQTLLSIRKAIQKRWRKTK